MFHRAPVDVVALIICNIPKGFRIPIMCTCSTIMKLILKRVWKPNEAAMLQACRQIQIGVGVIVDPAQPGGAARRGFENNSGEREDVLLKPGTVAPNRKVNAVRRGLRPGPRRNQNSERASQQYGGCAAQISMSVPFHFHLDQTVRNRKPRSVPVVASCSNRAAPT